MLRHTDSSSGREPPRSGSGRGKARTVLDRPPPLQGWRTSDEDEIELRRWRGRTEIVAIEALEPEQAFHGTFRVHSGSGGFYEVEIRSIEGFANSCGCIDHRVNGLGTCKHIEGVLAALRRRSAKAFREAALRGRARIEVFLDRSISCRGSTGCAVSARARRRARPSWRRSRTAPPHSNCSTTRCCPTSAKA